MKEAAEAWKAERPSGRSLEFTDEKGRLAGLYLLPGDHLIQATAASYKP